MGQIAAPRAMHQEYERINRRYLSTLQRIRTVLFLALSLFCSVTAFAAVPSGGQTAFRIGALRVMGDESGYLSAGLGAFNFTRHGPADGNDVSALARVEARFGPKLFFVGPVLGVMANSDGGVMGYAGMYTDIRYRRLVVTPMIGFGGYARGGSKLLGGIFQFRLSLEVSYEFDNHGRLGVAYAHISNSSIHHRNPSEQELMLTYAAPFCFQ